MPSKYLSDGLTDSARPVVPKACRHGWERVSASTFQLLNSPKSAKTAATTEAPNLCHTPICDECNKMAAKKQPIAKAVGCGKGTSTQLRTWHCTLMPQTTKASIPRSSTLHYCSNIHTQPSSCWRHVQPPHPPTSMPNPEATPSELLQKQSTSAHCACAAQSSGRCTHACCDLKCAEDPLHMHTMLRVVQHAAAWVQPVLQSSALLQSRGS